MTKPLCKPFYVSILPRTMNIRGESVHTLDRRDSERDYFLVQVYVDLDILNEGVKVVAHFHNLFDADNSFQYEFSDELTEQVLEKKLKAMWEATK